MVRTTPEGKQVDLYHAARQGKAWQRWLQVVYVLPAPGRPANDGGGTPV
jgi:hypothetical protein